MKDINKLWMRIMITYCFILIITFIIKLIGIDYFQLDYNNPIIQIIDATITKYKLNDLYFASTLYLYTLIFYSIYSGKKEYKISTYITVVNIV